MPKAEFIISEREWADGHQFGAKFLYGYQKERFHLPKSRYQIVQYRQMEQAGPFQKGHDLFGDGSLVLVPTLGHTYGHQSLLVYGRRPVCLAGDVIYTQQHLNHMIIDGVADSKKAAASTIVRFQGWSRQNGNAPILSSHDPEAGTLLFRRNGMI